MNKVTVIREEFDPYADVRRFWLVAEAFQHIKKGTPKNNFPRAALEALETSRIIFSRLRPDMLDEFDEDSKTHFLECVNYALQKCGKDHSFLWIDALHTALKQPFNAKFETKEFAEVFFWRLSIEILIDIQPFGSAA